MIERGLIAHEKSLLAGLTKRLAAIVACRLLHESVNRFVIG